MKLIRLLAPLALCLAPALQGAELKVAASSWPPYAEQTLPGQGLAIEIVTEALGRAGYELTITFGNWSRALEGTELGAFDVAASLWHTKERAAKLAFSEPYLTNHIKLLKCTDSDFTFEGLFAGREPGLTLGVVTNYAYEDLVARLDRPRVIPRNYVLQNLLKLTQGQIHLTLGDELALRYHLREYLRPEISRLEFSPPLASKGLHLAVSRSKSGHQEIVAAFDKAIAEMRADGTLQGLIDKYQ